MFVWGRGRGDQPPSWSRRWRGGTCASRSHSPRKCASSADRPIELTIAARFLPLIAAASPGEYDAYALRWLARWATETGTATIEQAAELAASLADLPVEPRMLEAITATL